MFDHRLLVNYGVLVKFLLTCSIPLSFILYRSLLRRREERRLVCALTDPPHSASLIKWPGGHLLIGASMSTSSRIAWKVASFVRSACKMHQSRQCQSNSGILHLYS